MLRALAFTIAAVAGIVACTTPPPQSTAQAPIATHSVPIQPGSGVVQQVFPAPPNVSAAGSSGRQPSGARFQRLEIRMDNGRTQVVDVPITEAIGEFSKGMRVQLTENGEIRRL